MHDGSLQSLAAAAIGCGNALDFLRAGEMEKAIQTITTAQGAVTGGITELRNSLVDLRAPVLQGGLQESADAFADQMTTLWGIPIEIRSTLTKEPPIPVALAVFQILQEGVTNALKHSQSESIDVHLSDDDGMVHVVVQDEGAGFEPSSHPGEDHVGMKLMRERAAQAGGWIEVDTRPGKGTRLTAVIPTA
jgi:two-component system nitrate/nitrite sensor histidine kinase NarX